MEKRTVKKIYYMDDFTLIRAIIIGITCFMFIKIDTFTVVS